MVLTPVGALSASDLEELDAQVGAFAAGEWSLAVEQVQVPLRVVAASEIEASLIQDLFGV